MKTIDIKCNACGYKSEIFIKNKRDMKCPTCGSKKVVRLWSGFKPRKPIFKGSGFYETDYKGE